MSEWPKGWPVTGLEARYVGRHIYRPWVLSIGGTVESHIVARCQTAGDGVLDVYADLCETPYRIAAPGLPAISGDVKAEVYASRGYGFVAVLAHLPNIWPEGHADVHDCQEMGCNPATPRHHVIARANL